MAKLSYQMSNGNMTTGLLAAPDPLVGTGVG
jgi:hypothetical protein